MDVKIFGFLLLVAVVVAVAVEGRGGRKRKGPSKEEQFHHFISAALSDEASRQLPPLSPGGDDGDDEAIKVAVDFSPTAVTDLHKKKGYVDVEGFMTKTYRDPRLHSSALANDNIMARIDPKNIWTPDIDLFNSVQPGLQVVEQRPVAIVTPRGHVTIVDKVKMRGLCDVIGQSKHVNCTLKLGSWGYSGEVIELSLGGDPSQMMSKYQPASQWNVSAATAWQGTDYYDCCPEPYPWVKFSFLLNKRRAR